ncbi:MAG: transglycosylase SLT domain-containing protein [Burkholderiaceae bacterium]|nr:transglycosylase SLT domain-containing protein [Burkholderiaceae bacterium]
MVALIGMWLANPAPAADCAPFRKLLTGHAHRLFGLDAPIPMFIAQITQESGCRPGVTAWDNGRGLAQFMDGTTEQVARLYPDLGTPAPYSPAWAIPAMLRYNGWLHARVRGDTECDRWAAVLKSYNAGLGYVQRAQRRSHTPGVWFNATENINAGQGDKNFEYSRRYPRLILFKHQPLYAAWGATLCAGVAP